MAAVTGVEVVLLDLDGTVYEGTRPVAGAARAVARLRELGLRVRFTTNTDSVPAAALVGRLAGMGIRAEEAELLTPVTLAGRLFAALPEARVLAVASPPVRDHLARFLAGSGESVTHVLVGDPSYGATYGDLDAAFRALRAGAELVATQVGRFVRRDDGEHLDTGGWVRLLEYAAGVRARVLGKPSPDFFRLAVRAAGSEPARALVVGDDVAADVAGARAVGCRAVLVRTGKGAGAPSPAGGGHLPPPPAGAEQAHPLPPAGTEQTPPPPAGGGPDAVIDSVASLPDLLGDPARLPDLLADPARPPADDARPGTPACGRRPAAGGELG